MERRLVAILAADVAGYPGRGGGRTPRITSPGFGWGLSCALKAKILRKPSGASAGQSLRLRARLQEHWYQQGEDAPIHAAMRADAMLDISDLDGHAVWKRILRAVEELQGTEPKLGEAVH